MVSTHKRNEQRELLQDEGKDLPEFVNEVVLQSLGLHLLLHIQMRKDLLERRQFLDEIRECADGLILCRSTFRRSCRHLALGDERLLGVSIEPDFGVVALEDIPGRALLEDRLSLGPVGDFSGLHDPVERFGLDGKGIDDPKRAKAYDHGIERLVLLNENDRSSMSRGIRYPVRRFDPVDDRLAIGTELGADESDTSNHASKGRDREAASMRSS